jgi:dolichyl-phosphate beta-glucosyltransferase
LSTNDGGASGGAAMAISIVIPAFNEANRLMGSLDRIADYMDAQHPDYEIVVVDDGSVDTTASLVRDRMARYPRLRLESYGTNRGKGYAIRYGVQRAHGDAILFSDADLSTPIEELDKLLPLLAAGADIVIGTRADPRSDVRVRQPFYRDRAGKLFNWLVRTLLLPALNDTQCGFKIFRRATVMPIIADLYVDRFAFDVEILYLADQRGLRISEVPVTWINSPDSRVRFTQGLAAFGELWRIRQRHRGNGRQ